ncbi:UNKNOWN [Stylonychia lemnae]|uniref:Transmembrane protein n=1 Tax=Stylonychia lemnae TaxID=5949 RepID=A0A077ZVH6_STYLE|nr:UNKNOWN [Stylonychia lemnae]|eukprot:CDW73859.1 UNKNOWN [Stylonychia lemnae]
MALKGFRQFISGFDIYGHQIKLLYNGEDTRKSLVGGILSLISIGLMLWYFIVQIMDIAQNKASIKQAQNPINIAQADITMDKTNFDLVFLINTQRPMNVQEIYTYIDFNVYFKSEEFIVNDDGELELKSSVNNLQMYQCPQDRMFNSTLYRNFTKAINLSNGLFICLDKNEKFKLKGRENAITFQIDKCDQTFLDSYYPGTKCVIKENLLSDFLNNTKLFTFTSQQYFDFDEFENDPIKVNVHVDKFNFQYYSQYELTYDILLNKVTGTDNKLHEQFEQFDKSFISTKISQAKVLDRNNKGPAYFDIKFQVLNEQNIIERQANNFVQALSNVGGLAGIIFGFLAILIAPLQEFLFYQSLLKKAFLVEKSKIQKEEGNQVHQSRKNSQENRHEIKKTLENPDFHTYLRLIRKLNDRIPFFYSIKTAIKQKFQQIFCCKKQRFQQELFELGKELIEKQFDISNILKDLRSFKMINSVLLSKFQRKLIPNFKKYLLTQKLYHQRQKERENKEQSQLQRANKSVIKSSPVTQLMIELFGHNKNPQNAYNQIVIEKIFMGKDKTQKDLSAQLYTGLLRQFIQLNIDNEFEENKIQGPLNQETVSYGVDIYDGRNDGNRANKVEQQFQPQQIIRKITTSRYNSDDEKEDEVSVLKRDVNPTMRTKLAPINTFQVDKNAVDKHYK